MQWHSRHALSHSSLHARAAFSHNDDDNSSSLLHLPLSTDAHMLVGRQSSDYSSSGSSGPDGSDSSGSGSGSDSGSDTGSSTGAGDSKVNTGPDSTSIAIACGVVIPLVAALVLFIFLHRRNVKRQRIEDATDKHGSLDFGMGEVRLGRGKNKPEMSQIEQQTHDMLRGGKGMSVDMGSPYVLPGDPVSRTSFNSMSRSLQDGEDPYRPVQMIRSGQNSPTFQHQYNSSRLDTPSLFTVSSKSPLINDASQPGHVASPVDSSGSPAHLDMPLPPVPIIRKPVASPLGAELDGTPQNNGHDHDHNQPRSELDSTPASYPAHAEHDADSQAYKAPAGGNFETSFELPDDAASHIGPFDDSHAAATTAPPEPPRRSSMRNAPPAIVEPGQGRDSTPLEDYTTYADVLGIAQGPTAGAVPTIHEPAPGLGPDAHATNGLTPGDAARYSTHIRPLPPTDPNDTAEQRANRIRSFYREYFDDSNDNSNVAGGQGDYYEDYGQEYLNEAAIYDPETGQFIMPGAPYGQPIGRRAMTPPPRGPPRFRGGPGYGTRSSGGTYSGGGRQRAYSSASGRPPTGARGRPVKKLPPPSPLTTLPTPSSLKEDTGIFDVLDFAPPTSFRDRQLGRPDSPGGNVTRPYSPSVRPFSPLVSSHDDLMVMPSPHMLRKSSTFTGLDFALPPRFKDMGNGSDNASIRSGRSARGGHLTPLGERNIRQGAYRVSRLPPEMVGTKDDLAVSLRPRMNLVIDG